MKRQLQGLALATMICGGAGAAGAVGVLIDEFGPPTQTLTIPALSPALSSAETGPGGQCGSTALGGCRKLQIITENGSGASPVTVDVNSDPGILTFGTGPGSAGRVLIRWDGTDTAFAVAGNSLVGSGIGGGVDLTDGGTADRFRFTITNLDVSLAATISVCNKTTTICYTDEFQKPALLNGDPTPSPEIPPGDPAQDHFITDNGVSPFFLERACAGVFTISSDIAVGDCTHTPADQALVLAAVQNAGSVHLRLRKFDETSGGGIDLLMTSFETTGNPIPEPASIGLLGSGILIMAVAAARRRRARRTPRAGK